MRRFVAVAILIVACEPQQTQPAVVAAPSDTQPRADACRDDIPDCAAACALRETHRSDYVDFYERRCAAVILGKNPDKIEPLEPTPYPGDGSAAGGTSQTGSATPSATAAASPEFPPQNRASLSLQPPPPFDPTAVPRTGGSDPPECKAARLLRIQHHDREADMMNALCIAKGGDGGV